ncbi:MAG: hypothetical protein DRP57_04705 [Spirochaetes bacterium]|nr:MAG: hypothetical protein DRP57_04705 [Spirochaetota bacterium]
MEKPESLLICNKKIDSLFFRLVIINITTMAAGMLFYGEPFKFWQDAISYLGATKTVKGYPNRTSFFIFALGMGISGVLMFKIASIFHRHKNIEHPILKRDLSFSAGLGFFIIIFPCNTNNSIHSIGGALLFGDLWGLTLIMLIEAGKLPGAKYISIYHFILHTTVLAYAFNFVIQSGIMQITQKFAVFSLITVLKLTTALYRLSPFYTETAEPAVRISKTPKIASNSSDELCEECIKGNG